MSVDGGGLTLLTTQALIGAGTVVSAYLIGRDLFNARAGLIAGCLCAIYPYYVVHDTAVQETGLYTFLTALAVVFLVRLRREPRVRWAAVAGATLGASLMTRVTIAPFVVLVPVWLVALGAGDLRRRIVLAGVVAIGAAVVSGPWLVRNYMLLGRPVVTSLTGYLMWVGNNPYTFSHYPEGQIDESRNVAAAAMSRADVEDLASHSTNEIEASDWYERRAVAYMRAHPLATLRGAARKVVAGFSWVFSPRKGPLAQSVYFLSYAPILLLGLLGAFATRRAWRDHVIIYLLFLTFIGVTAVFWAHTAHRSFLDVYLMIFASAALVRLCDAWARRRAHAATP